MEDYSDNDDLYNFDITPAKSLQKPRKSKREKLEEKEERRRILSKTKGKCTVKSLSLSPFIDFLFVL